MLKDALQLIQETAQKARGVRTLGLSADGRVERFDVDGKIQTLDVPPIPRGHVVCSLADLIDYVQTAAQPVVWYSVGKVVLILDDDRRDRVTFVLTPSDQLGTLGRRGSSPPLTQRELLHFLRFELGVKPETVNLFRKLDWTNNAKAASSLGSTGESLGLEVRAECSGVAELPDELRVAVPVYREFGERELWPVLLLIEIDAESMTFSVQPAPGELDRIVQQAQQSIGERLAALTCPTYYGTP